MPVRFFRIMHIIIDGYNLIRQSAVLRRHERQSLEAGRRALIHRISLYKSQRNHRVTIVFDGREGNAPEEERDIQEGVPILYSRRGDTADEVIKRLSRDKKEEIVVVTSDRPLADYVRRRGVVAVSSGEFEQLLSGSGASGERTKAAEEEEDDGEEDTSPGRKAVKKGPARRLSRRERLTRKGIERL
jgi:uncharacterized protein